MRMPPSFPFRSIRIHYIVAAGISLVVFGFYAYQDELNLFGNVYNHPDKPSSPYLPRIISMDEYNQLIQLLTDFLDLCQAHNITVVMSFGTLIGSYMFHDVIPWDDDVDLWIPYSDLPKVKRLFQKPEHWKTHHVCGWRKPLDEFDFDVLSEFPDDAPDEVFYQSRYNDNRSEPSHVFKYFRAESPHAGKYQWHWPFLDVVFYRENATHVWNHEFRNIMYIPYDKFYPMIKRPLAGLWLNAPVDTGYVLRSRYGAFKCRCNHYNHKKEKRYAWFLRVLGHTDCTKLWNTYPQVWAETAGSGLMKETLKVGDDILYSLVIQTHTSPEKVSLRPFDF